jgi:hypothetical protein
LSELFELPCAECSAQIVFGDEDETFHCARCECDYEFLLCPACDSVVQVKRQRRGVYGCQWCGTRVEFRSTDKATAPAGDRLAEIEERGLLGADADTVFVTGFALVGVSGFAVELGATCSLLTLPDAVDVRAEVGGQGVATIPYRDLTELDITSAGLVIDAAPGELLLHHGQISQPNLRRMLSPLFARYHAARHAERSPLRSEDPVALLERLAALREKGVLSEEEYQAARAREVGRLVDGA